jgi:UDP-N-acetyl-D-mannosaminuronic acid dehydrogenase
MTVGVLGMAFKAESDDIRSSLSYKLKRILKFKANLVLCADSFVNDDDSLVSEDELIEKSDLIVIGTPHNRYSVMSIKKPVIDVWNIRKQGVLI